VLGRDAVVEEIGSAELLAVREDIAKSKPSVKTLANEIGRARVVLNYGWKEGLIDRPIRFGESFKKRGKAAFPKIGSARTGAGQVLFSGCGHPPATDRADVHMKAMILLGINRGLGTRIAADWSCRPWIWTRWMDYPRPKTGIPRRSHLAETCPLCAIHRRAKNAKAAEHTSTVFVTKYGALVVKPESRANPLSAEFKKCSRLRRSTASRCVSTLSGTRDDRRTRRRDRCCEACMGHGTFDGGDVPRRDRRRRLQAVVTTSTMDIRPIPCEKETVRQTAIVARLAANPSGTANGFRWSPDLRRSQQPSQRRDGRCQGWAR